LDTLRAREAELSRNPDFPMSMPVVGLSLFFAGGSEQTNVVINEVVPPSAVGQETIGSKNYPAYATQVTVSGTLNQIISFLQYLEAGGFSSIRVQNLSTAGTGVLWTATITTVVISQT
jgi:hypothetical protein